MRRKATVERSTPEQALAALLGLWNRHQFGPFPVNLRGSGTAALLLARELGWVWGDRGAMSLTLAGVQALSAHLGRDLVEEEIRAERTRRHWSEAAE